MTDELKDRVAELAAYALPLLGDTIMVLFAIVIPLALLVAAFVLT